MPTEETLKQLLNEMVEQEALVSEELKVIDEQIASLEVKLTESRARLARVANDRDKVLNMKQRYVDGVDVPVSVNYSSAVPAASSNGERQIKVQSVKEVKNRETGQHKAQLLPEEVPAAKLVVEEAPPVKPVVEEPPAIVLTPPPQEQLPIPEAPPLPQIQTPPVVEPEEVSMPVQTTSMPVERDDSDTNQKNSGAHGRPSGISALLEGLRSRDNLPRSEAVQEQAGSTTLPVPDQSPTATAPSSAVLPVAQDPSPLQQEEATNAAQADGSSEIATTESAEPAEEGDSDTVKSINDALRSLFR